MAEYPHMCRDGHPEIGHSDSGEDERCPLCRALDVCDSIDARLGQCMDRWNEAVARAEKAEAERDEALRAVDAWQREASETAARAHSFCVERDEARAAGIRALPLPDPAPRRTTARGLDDETRAKLGLRAVDPQPDPVTAARAAAESVLVEAPDLRDGAMTRETVIANAITHATSPAVARRARLERAVIDAASDFREQFRDGRYEPRDESKPLMVGRLCDAVDALRADMGGGGA